MYKYMLKRDLKRLYKHYAIILLILNISIVIINISYNDFKWILGSATCILIGTILLSEMFTIDVATRISINHDLKQSNYYLTKIDDFGIYINYKYFLNFFALLIVLSVSYLTFSIVNLLPPVESLKAYLLCVLFFIYWSFLLTMFTTVISNFLLLLKISDKRLAVLYLIGGLIIWQIGLFTTTNNNLVLYVIRTCFTVFILNYICGMIINKSRRIR